MTKVLGVIATLSTPHAGWTKQYRVEDQIWIRTLKDIDDDLELFVAQYIATGIYFWTNFIRIHFLF